MIDLNKYSKDVQEEINYMISFIWKREDINREQVYKNCIVEVMSNYTPHSQISVIYNKTHDYPLEKIEIISNFGKEDDYVYYNIVVDKEDTKVISEEYIQRMSMSSHQKNTIIEQLRGCRFSTRQIKEIVSVLKDTSKNLSVNILVTRNNMQTFNVEYLEGLVEDAKINNASKITLLIKPDEGKEK